MDLVVLDDFGLSYLEQQQQLDLMEIVKERHRQRSIVMASQLPVGNWCDMIGEETIADAILDQLAHSFYQTEFKGDRSR